MEKKSSFEMSFILPAMLGALSLIGIAVVLLVGRNNQRKPVVLQETETPFKYIYLGTEPGLSTLTPEITDTPEMLDTPVAPPIVLEPDDNGVAPTNPFFTSTPIPVSTVIVPVTVTPTVSSILSRFDDTYFEFLYKGDWVAQSNVSDAYQNTLHISFAVGNSVSFTVVGEQVIVSYQAGPSLGTISINLDGIVIEVNQSDTDTQLKNWTSTLLVRGTHTIQITHISGGSVNLDAITIPNLTTPTPTATP